MAEFKQMIPPNATTLPLLNPTDAASGFTGTNKKVNDLAKVSDYNVDLKNEYLTNDTGVRINHDDDTLKVGARGPTVIQDFYFRQKMTHFDHERIPERVVHARGSAAHGYFQVYENQEAVTKAGFLCDPSRKTPVFVRFSTVLGSKGSADTVRDVRGFATRFYTDEGNFDLVGNNIPVFFVQDAIKFPDIIHAGKPEPHCEIPQGATAHDNFWDFISLNDETAHMVMWALSDRAIPRSYRMMEGFGVNTFTLVNKEGVRRFVKFHWKPLLGAHSMVWDEANKLMGVDPDYHRRDLWQAIESGAYPEYEFGIQLIDEKDEHKFDFDILDATKLWPEELIPVKKIGRMVLNRNPAEFFTETEQVAYCIQNLVPGIDVSNDPLLQGRLFSYLDTQLLRLGGPNFQEIPINRPVCPFMQNMFRDGFSRQKISTSTVNYHPNRFDRIKPAPESAGGYVHYPAAVDAGIMICARGPKFQERFNQATLFYNSLTLAEKSHLVDAARFELGRVDDEGVSKRMLEMFNKIDHDLAKLVAEGLGLPAPAQAVTKNHGQKSAALSLDNQAKDSILSRKVAILVAPGFSYSQVSAMRAGVHAAGGLCFLVGPHRRAIESDQKGSTLIADWTYDTAKSVMFDAVYIPGGVASVNALGHLGAATAWVNETYKHFKPIVATGEGVTFLAQHTGLPKVAAMRKLTETAASTPDEVVSIEGVVALTNWTPGDVATLARGAAGAVLGEKGSQMVAPPVVKSFIDAIKQHRHWGRTIASVPA